MSKPIPVEVQLTFDEVADYLRVYFRQVEKIEPGPMFYSTDESGVLEVHFKATIENKESTNG